MAVISLIFPFSHFSLAPNFIIGALCLKREFGYIPNPDRYGVILGKALDPPWSIHILNGHTDNPQVPAILPARLDAVRSSYFRLALENRVSIICQMKRLEC